MAIQNLFSSRDNNVNANTYVGQTGRVWFNLDDNTFYVSDGSTPGGIAIGGSSDYGDSNVATFLAAFGSNVILTTGNITAGNIVTAGQGDLDNIVTDAIQFDVTAAETNGVAKLYWNADEETLRFGLDAGTLIDIGQDMVYRVQAASNITKGQVVQFTGVVGDKIAAAPANAAAPNFNSLFVIGLAAENIDAGNIGFVTSQGKVRDINTGSFSVGNILYLDPATPGGLTVTEPSAPNAKVVVAAVLKTSPGNGGIYETRVTAYPRLRDIQDVNTTAAAGNDFLVYSGNVWQHQALDISLDTTPTLGGNLDGASYDISNIGVLSVNSANSAAAVIVNAGGNGVGNIGSASAYFDTAHVKATSAQYADLAELYRADAYYEPGTVMEFGGAAEITMCNIDNSTSVAGVVSTNPSYVMNAGLTDPYTITLSLTGRVPCQVIGPVRKGDLMVSAGQGRAKSNNMARAGTIIGKALENFDGSQGTIEVVVGLS